MEEIKTFKEKKYTIMEEKLTLEKTSQCKWTEICWSGKTAIDHTGNVNKQEDADENLNKIWIT